MMVLAGGSIILKHSNASSWLEAGAADTRVLIADALLLGTLLTLVDLGAGTFAAVLGALIVMGYLLAAGGALGSAILAWEKEVFG
jgi:phage-related tail protein